MGLEVANRFKTDLATGFRCRRTPALTPFLTSKLGAPETLGDLPKIKQQ